MAALFQPSPHDLDAPASSGRPQLRVIHGGATDAARRREAIRRAQRRRARQRVFLVRRLVVLGSLVVLGAVTTGLIGSAGSADAGTDVAAAAGPTLASATYVVQPGDTLWSIASSLGVDADIRNVVADLAEANGGSSIRVGQRLDIPRSLRG